MSPDYVNDFSNPDPDNHAFAPQTNTYRIPTSPSTLIKPMGDMLAGRSVPYAHPRRPPTFDLPVSDSPGILLEFDPKYAPDSRTICLTDLEYGSRFFLPDDSQLTAEIVLDMPWGTDVPGETSCDKKVRKWGVGLFLKSGNQYEYPTDKLMGPTFQFFNGGNINFHGTDYCRFTSGSVYCTQEPSCPQQVSWGSYTDYPAGFNFSLSLSIWRNIAEIDLPPLSGNATLRFGPNNPRSGRGIAEFTGELAMQDRRLKEKDGKTPIPYYDIDWVRAIGVSLVCANNDVNSIRVRLKKFTVSVTPKP